MTTFNKLPIGALFHTGKSQGAGIERETTYWQVLSKVSPSKAKVVQVVNLPGRSIGAIYCMAASTKV